VVRADIPDRNVGIDPLAALVAGAPTAYGPAILIPVSRRRTFQPARTGSAIADLGRQPRRPPLTSSFWRPGGASLIPACMGRIPSPCRPAPPRGPDRRSGRERYQSATKALPKHHQNTTVGFGRQYGGTISTHQDVIPGLAERESWTDGFTSVKTGITWEMSVQYPCGARVAPETRAGGGEASHRRSGNCRDRL